MTPKIQQQKFFLLVWEVLEKTREQKNNRYFIQSIATSGFSKANRIIGTCTYSVKDNKENNDSIPPVGDVVVVRARAVESNSTLDSYILFLSTPMLPFWNLRMRILKFYMNGSHSNEEKDTFLGGYHGRMVLVKVSRMMEVPSGILLCCIEEADKEEIYRLYMEDQEHNTGEELAKAYNTSTESIVICFIVRDMLNFSKKITLAKKLLMFKLSRVKPKIFTTSRLAKDYGVASPSILRTMYQLRFNVVGS